MSETARRRQPPITIRSAKAAARLGLLTRDGRSQAEVIEDALERMPLPRAACSAEERVARIKAIVATVDRAYLPTMAELDAVEYDADGNPR
jgi:hypothetical protein